MYPAGEVPDPDSLAVNPGRDIGLWYRINIVRRVLLELLSSLL
jgi:hypothetical protein